MNRVAGFLIAPTPAAIIGGVISWASGAHPRGHSIAILYLLQLYALQLVFGLAIFAWLRRRGLESIQSFSLGGSAMVAIVAVPYLAWAGSLPGNTPGKAALVLAIWLALGGITGATAWLVTRPSRSSAGDN